MQSCTTAPVNLHTTDTAMFTALFADPISALVYAARGGHEAIFQILTSASFATYKGFNPEKKTFKEYSRPIYSIPFRREKKCKTKEDDGLEVVDAEVSTEGDEATATSSTWTVTTAMKEAVKNSSEIALKVLDQCLTVPDKTDAAIEKWTPFKR